jgi:hypothetical protein
MIHRHNGLLLDPAHESSKDGGEFIDGTRYKQLRDRLCAAAGPNAVLLPLILSSGSFDVLRALLFIVVT